MAKKNFEKLERFIDQKLGTHLSQRVICRDIQVHGHQQVGFELTALTWKPNQVLTSQSTVLCQLKGQPKAARKSSCAVS